MDNLPQDNISELAQAISAAPEPISDPVEVPQQDNAENVEAQPQADAEAIEVEGDESEAQAEDEGTSEEVQEPVQAQAVEINVDGQTLKLTPDEVAAGYLRQQDYSRKTQALAENVRAFEAEAAQIKQHQLATLEALNKRFQELDPVGLLTQEYRRALSEGDTEAALLAKDRAEQLKAEQDAVRQVLEAEQSTKAQMSQQEAQAFIQKESAALFEKMPFLSDEKRLKGFQEAVNTACEKVGYSKEELAAMDKPDHRQAMLAYYAGQYLKSLDNKPQVAQAIKGKVVSPNPTPRGQKTGYNAALQTLKSNTRSVDALAQALAFS